MKQVNLGTGRFLAGITEQKYRTSRQNTCWIQKSWKHDSRHRRVGEIQLYDRDKVVAHWLLVTLERVDKGGLFSRLSDYLHHKIYPFWADWQGCESAHIINNS